MNKDIYHIASDYFNGGISESDLRSLQAWLSQSPDNRKLLDELQKVWELTGSLSFDIEPDIETEWARFVRKRDESASGLKPIRQIHWSSTLKIAAVLIPAVLVLSVWLIYLLNHNRQSDWVTISASKEKKELLLADGSKVWINRNTNFSYPAKFLSTIREVKLEGEAFFEVAKGKAPFKINTSKTEITVLGTAFNVRAYNKESFTEVVVRNGKVAFEETISRKQKIVLNGGDKGILNNDSLSVTKQVITDFNVAGWKENRLSFHDTPLSEIQTIMNRYFDVSVEVASSMGRCKFTGEFTNPVLNEMLNVISVSLGGTYKIKNDTVFITGQGCIK